MRCLRADDSQAAGADEKPRETGKTMVEHFVG